MTATRFPVEVDVVVPLRGVEQVAAEGLDALDVRQLRGGQPAGGVDQRGAGQLAGRRTDPPHHRLVVPVGPEQLDAEVEAVEHAGLGRHLLEVGEDLGLRRVRVGPVRVRREREAVEVARDVTGGTGVGVGPPGAAQCLVLLDDQEVLTVFLEPPGQAHAAEPCADDDVLDVGGEGHAADGTGPPRWSRKDEVLSRDPGPPAVMGAPWPLAWGRGRSESRGALSMVGEAVMPPRSPPHLGRPSRQPVDALWAPVGVVSRLGRERPRTSTTETIGG